MVASIELAADGLSENTVDSVVPGRFVLRSARGRAIHASLLTAILDHRLAPGMRLPEDEIGALFGASRTIARDALQALAHEGLVTIEANRGAFVAHPTPAEARHVFEARFLLEPRMAALAAERATAEDVARLRAHAKEEHEALHARDNRRAIFLSGTFHGLIADIAAQPVLAGFVREVVSRSSLIVALFWRRQDTTCERHAHEALVGAIERHDAKAASGLMESHLVDLFSGLDLSERAVRPASLAELIGPGQG